jgi:hypothetical protein
MPLGLVMGVVGAALLVAVWGDCLRPVTDFFELFISPILKPAGEIFGLDQGDLFRSDSGVCRDWWADSVWLAGAVILVSGTGFFLAGSYKFVSGLFNGPTR